MKKNNLFFTTLTVLLFSLNSCSNELTPNEEQNCTLHSGKELATYFDSGNYSFSCMNDAGPMTVEFPVLVNNHKIVTETEDAVEYILSVIYKETQDRAIGDFLFATTFADNASETKESITDLGDEAYFYVIKNDDILRHYLVFRDCNFVSTIAGEYDSANTEPCNLGKEAFVQFAKEIKNNI